MSTENLPSTALWTPCRTMPWQQKRDDTCPLCGNWQTLIHVLNTCPVTLQARQFNHRHDAVLRRIVYTISSHLQPTAQLTSDLSDYHFPHHIIPTTQRPDVVWRDDSKKKLYLIELTVYFETLFNDVRERKMARYTNRLKRKDIIQLSSPWKLDLGALYTIRVFLLSKTNYICQTKQL